LARRFIDPDAEFVVLPAKTDWTAITDGIVFDVPPCELGHRAECSFAAIIHKYAVRQSYHSTTRQSPSIL
jgi:hypothetical protein